jgi:hypothetical protein
LFDAWSQAAGLGLPFNLFGSIYFSQTQTMAMHFKV